MIPNWARCHVCGEKATTTVIVIRRARYSCEAHKNVKS